MGEFSHTIDSKGRLIIPAKFREELGEQCVITRGFDNCLAVYTQESWNHISSALATQSTTKTQIRALQRFYFGSAAELDFDKQGRVLVPGSLRKHAELEKDVVLVGANNHIEIWSRKKWEAYNDEIDINIEALVEDMDGLML